MMDDKAVIEDLMKWAESLEKSLDCTEWITIDNLLALDSSLASAYSGSIRTIEGMIRSHIREIRGISKDIEAGHHRRY